MSTSTKEEVDIFRSKVKKIFWGGGPTPLGASTWQFSSSCSGFWALFFAVQLPIVQARNTAFGLTQLAAAACMQCTAQRQQKTSNTSLLESRNLRVRSVCTPLRLPTEGWPGWVYLGVWLYTEIGFRHRELNPVPVTHPSTNRARRRVTDRDQRCTTMPNYRRLKTHILWFQPLTYVRVRSTLNTSRNGLREIIWRLIAVSL